MENSMSDWKMSENPLGEINLTEAPRQALARYKAIWEEKRKQWGYYPGEERSWR